jgi:hypothetical protein
MNINISNSTIKKQRTSRHCYRRVVVRQNGAGVNIGTTAPVEGAAPTPTANHPLPSERDNPRQFACLIATATITISDGSQFAEKLTASNTSSAISGLTLSRRKPSRRQNDDTPSTVITATQGCQSTSAEFSL